MNSELIKLRHELHQHPELSGAEFNTAERVRAFIEKHHPTTIIENIGGTGLAVIYKAAKSGPTVAIRCELDALPIAENNQFDHRSITAGVSHKCGHDGHMAIVAGLIFWLKKEPLKRGKVILLFQPAEETGQGAYKMLQDARFKKLGIDYLFSLHNIPREPLHQIITMKSGFSAEVQSFALTLKGKESHAAEPENGINPAVGIAEMITALTALNVADPIAENFTILTPVHINMGQKAYGVSPANGELHYTIRTWSTAQMNHLKLNIKAIFKKNCTAQQLDYQVEWFEHFPASQNDAACNEYVTAAAKTNGLDIQERPYPFKFGEDFGWFSKEYKTAMFGLGAGMDTPALHHADYDFPDEVLETGVAMFGAVIDQVISE